LQGISGLINFVIELRMVRLLFGGSMKFRKEKIVSNLKNWRWWLCMTPALILILIFGTLSVIEAMFRFTADILKYINLANRRSPKWFRKAIKWASK